jgi:hypothetical protein
MRPWQGIIQRSSSGHERFEHASAEANILARTAWPLLYSCHYAVRLENRRSLACIFRLPAGVTQAVLQAKCAESQLPPTRRKFAIREINEHWPDQRWKAPLVVGCGLRKDGRCRLSASTGRASRSPAWRLPEPILPLAGKIRRRASLPIDRGGRPLCAARRQPRGRAGRGTCVAANPRQDAIRRATRPRAPSPGGPRPLRRANQPASS